MSVRRELQEIGVLLATHRGPSSSAALLFSFPSCLPPPPALGILIPRETLAGTAHNRHLALSSITFPSRTSVARNQSSSGGRGRRRKAGGSGREESALPPVVEVDDVVVVLVVRVEGGGTGKGGALMMMCVAGRQGMMRSLSLGVLLSLAGRTSRVL